MKKETLKKIKTNIMKAFFVISILNWILFISLVVMAFLKINIPVIETILLFVLNTIMTYYLSIFFTDTIYTL